MDLRQQRKLERRNRVLDAAAEYISELESTDFSMQELAERGGVSARTLYNLFECKEQLLADLAHKIMHGLGDELAETNDDDPIELSRKIALLPVHFLIRRPRLLAPMASTWVGATAPSLGTALRHRQEEALREAAQRGLLVREVKPATLAFQIQSQVLHNSIWWGMGNITDKGMLSLVEHHWTLIMAAATVDPVRARLLDRLAASQQGVAEVIHGFDDMHLEQLAHEHAPGGRGR